MAENILHFPNTLELVPMLQATVIKHYQVGPMTCWDKTGHAIMDKRSMCYHQSQHLSIYGLYKLAFLYLVPVYEYIRLDLLYV